MSFEEQLGQAITKASGWFLDTAFLTGNGASAPAGVINSPATISAPITPDHGDTLSPFVILGARA